MYQEKLLHWTFISKKKPIGIDINAIKIDTIISYFRDTLQVISCFQYFKMSFSLFFNFLINLFLMGFSPIYLGLIGKITLSSPPPPSAVYPWQDYTGDGWQEMSGFKNVTLHPQLMDLFANIV